MSITIRRAQTISNGVTMRGNDTQVIPNIVTNGLIAHLDAGVTISYSGTGTTWYDLSGNNADATLNGTIGFVDRGASSYFTFNGNAANCITSSLPQEYLDCTLVFYPDFTYNSTNANLAYGLGAGADRTMRFGYADGTGPWTIGNPGNDGDWAYLTPTTYYINGTAIPGAGNLVDGWNILGAARTNQWGDFAYAWGTGYYTRGFKGRLAAILLYNRVLTADEQQQNYQYFIGRKEYQQDAIPTAVVNFDTLYYDRGSTWIDQSGNGHNMTLNNYYTTVENAILVSGPGSYGEIAYTSDFDLSNKFSIAMWINFTVFVPSGDPEIIRFNYCAFRIDSQTTSPQFNLVKYGVADQRVSVVISTDQWYHIVVSQSPTEVIYYMNGVSVGSFTNSSAPIGDTNPITIGSGQPIKLKQLQMYNTALTSSQVTKLFNQDKSRYGL